jgi:hypothetical protein
MATKRSTSKKQQQPRKANGSKPRKKAMKLDIDTVTPARKVYPETAEGNARAIKDEKQAECRASYAKRITAAFSKSVEAIIEVGRLLDEAKKELGDYTEWCRLVMDDLRISARTGERLITIARNALLATHVSVLPAHWGTLYELTLLPKPLLLTKIKEGELTTTTERQTVAGWRHKEEEEKKAREEEEKARKEEEEKKAREKEEEKKKARGNVEPEPNDDQGDNDGAEEEGQDGGGDEPEPIEPEPTDPWADFERDLNTIGQLRDYIEEAIEKGATPNSRVWLDNNHGLWDVSFHFVEDDEDGEPPMMVITSEAAEEAEDAEDAPGAPANRCAGY